MSKKLLQGGKMRYPNRKKKFELYIHHVTGGGGKEKPDGRL